MSMLISTLLGKSIFTNINSVVKRKWPDCTGLDILADKVYNICKGVVVFVGLNIDNTYVVNVQIDATQFIRYCNLKSESVSPNQALNVGDLIGVADEYVRIEYCNNTDSGQSCVRLGGTTYCKHDPYPFLCGDEEIIVSGRSSYDLAQSGLLYDPKQLINTDAITPYIVTSSPNVKSIDFSKLKSIDVVGAMLYGGGLYDASHIKKSSYRNSNIDSLIKSADSAGLGYGLYVDVRARSTDEAKEECKQLYFLIASYPPKLGVWLKLNLVTPKSINDKILNIYQHELDRAGWSGQYGLYVNRSQLNNVSWNIHQDKFLLCLDDHLDRIDIVQELLTPDFFKL